MFQAGCWPPKKSLKLSLLVLAPACSADGHRGAECPSLPMQPHAQHIAGPAFPTHHLLGKLCLHCSTWFFIIHSVISCFVALDLGCSSWLTHIKPTAPFCKHRSTWKWCCRWYSLYKIHITSQDSAVQGSQGKQSAMAYDETFFLPLRNENLWLQRDRYSASLCFSNFPAYFAYNCKWSNLMLIWLLFIFLSSMSEWFFRLRKWI